MKLSLFNFVLSFYTCFAVDVPQYFRGSPELFSGHLPESDIYIQSLTYHKGLVIEGSAMEVENTLAKSNPKGMYHLSHYQCFKISKDIDRKLLHNIHLKGNYDKNFLL